MKVLDVSRQSTGFVITVEQFKRAKADGFEAVIVGLWDGGTGNPYAKETLAHAQEAGLLIAGYTALAEGTGGDAVYKAKLFAGPSFYNLSFLSIDVELDGCTVFQVQDAINNTLALGQRPVVYTAYWFWVSRMGNPTNFSTVPLWNAFYDGDPDFDIAQRPYGGWTQSCGEQYLGTQSFAYGGKKFGADVNEFIDSFFRSGPGTNTGLVLLAKAWKDDMSDSIKGSVALHEDLVLNKVALALYAVRQKQKAENWSRLLP